MKINQSKYDIVTPSRFVAEISIYLMSFAEIHAPPA